MPITEKPGDDGGGRRAAAMGGRRRREACGRGWAAMRARSDVVLGFERCLAQAMDFVKSVVRLEVLKVGYVGIRFLRPSIVVIELGIKHVAYTHDIPFQLRQPFPCFVVASLFSYQDVRARGDSALSFPLCAEWLATTVHRLGVDASGKGASRGNPGFTAVRGFNPAGGAPRGG
ncbi:mediator of RNA polymerase II transcription subunit 12-like [Dorcoceras hygrometricum]|uniref:Mediator of RNA polymerase II transcription subunit 12-like n=1 Tax=Dorcoceras hygrometricum TaxID=472368 RepID=A0A2Z7DDW5_9LAMI|nr:mediator of RNA polymerase II transcription subunit 12-like [Dorcoceras hygrometricum]